MRLPVTQPWNPPGLECSRNNLQRLGGCSSLQTLARPVMSPVPYIWFLTRCWKWNGSLTHVQRGPISVQDSLPDYKNHGLEWWNQGLSRCLDVPFIFLFCSPLLPFIIVLKSSRFLECLENLQYQQPPIWNIGVSDGKCTRCMTLLLTYMFQPMEGLVRVIVVSICLHC